MIGLMRDAQLKVREAVNLIWADIEQLADGTGRVAVRPPQAEGAVERRLLSSSTMRTLAALERSGSDERILNLSPNRIGIRISHAARQAGLGAGYAGESPRMGMLADLETIAVELLGEYADL